MDLRGQVESFAESYDEEVDAVKKIQDILAQFDSLQSLEETLSLTLPNEFAASFVVNDLTGLATINQLAVQSAATDLLPFNAVAGAPEYAKNIGTIKIATKISGSYENFKTFIAQLETNARIFDVESLKIMPPSPVKGPLISPLQNQYQYELTLHTYYQEGAH